MFIKNKKGFTLIELLVVISIIGLLASIILASLNVAKLKARDASIKEMMGSLKIAAENYYTAHNNQYSSNTSVGLQTDPYGFFSDADYIKIRNAINLINGSGYIQGHQITSDWCVFSDLNTGIPGAQSWCADADNYTGPENVGCSITAKCQGISNIHNPAL